MLPLKVGSMTPADIVYARSNLGETIRLLFKACETYGYTLWSLRGDPMSLQYGPSTNSMRVSVYASHIDPHKALTAESCLGTAHVVQVSPEKTRITFRHDDLAGAPLPEGREPAFDKYVAFFKEMLDFNKKILSDLETGGMTSVLNNHVADTGPLPA